MNKVGVGAPPPPPLNAVPPPSIGAGRAGLLDQIHSGFQLKKVDQCQPKPAVTDDRSSLLSEIREGRKLNSVSDDDRASANPVELEGMAGALAKALAQRGKHIQVNDDSDVDEDDDDFDDDDWDD